MCYMPAVAAELADVAEVVRQLGEGFTVATPEEYLRLVKHNLGP